MKIDASTIEKYQLILEKDPNSQVFAPLAEAYREMGMLQEAQKTILAGMQRHPQFVSGLVTLGKIMRDVGEYKKALDALNKAVILAPENILAQQVLGEVHLANKDPKQALKAFKMVLFLNPHSKSAQKSVQKLESITADEFDDEVFSMTKLPEVNLTSSSGVSAKPHLPSDMIVPSAPTSPNKAMDRMLSLIDAFIVRNDLEKAHVLLKDTRAEFGDHPEIQRRMKTLQVRYNESDEATPLRPLQPREQVVRERKLEVLRMMLSKIEDYRQQI